MRLPFSPVAEPFIVEEGAGWLLVFKPAGMDSLPLNRNPLGYEERGTLEGWLGLNAPAGTESMREMGMLSRLDRDTSGLILCAKDAAAFGLLKQSRDLGLIRKRYRLRCSASETPMDGSRPERFPTASPIAGPADMIGLKIESRFRAYGEGAKKVACVAEETAKAFKGKLSKGTSTTLILDACLSEADSGLVRGFLADVEITRGFRHQIRAHMAWLGFPIDGDVLYGGKPAPRLFLEAVGIAFPEPGSEGRTVEFMLYGETT